MASVLVVGSAGQLGFELMRASWPGDLEPVGRTRTELDITDGESVARAVAEIEPAVIVNAAAYTEVDRAEDEPSRAFAINRDGARILAERGVPLVHVSTDYVFDGEKDAPYLETDAVRPLGVYGESKLAGELAVRQASDRHVIVRTSWVFGVHGKNFVKTMLRIATERDQIRVVDDQRGCPTPAAAIAGAIARIAERIVAGDARFGTFHFGGAPVTSWFDFAGAIFEEQRGRGASAPELVPIASHEYPLKAPRAKNSALDCSAIQRAYGIEPPSWRQGLRAVLDELARRTAA